MTKKKAGPPKHNPGPQGREERLRLHYEEFKSRGIGAEEAKRLAKAVVARDDDPTTPNPELRLSRDEQARHDKREQSRLARIPPEEVLPEPQTLEEVTPAHLRQAMNAELSKLKLEGTAHVGPPPEQVPAPPAPTVPPEIA